MKLMQRLTIVVLTGGVLWAQTPAQPAGKPPAQSAAKPAATAPAATAKQATPAPAPSKPAATNATSAKPASTAAKPAAAAATPAKPVSKPTTPASATAKPAAAPAQLAAGQKKMDADVPKKDAPKKAEAKAEKSEPAGEVKNASVKEQQTATRVSAVPKPGVNKRDPFVSPIVRAAGGAVGPVCETGKRCLMVDQIQLKGIVKSPNGYIAVVENAAKRAYFLRENDPVFNGAVIKITGDSVIFREQVTDKLGKQATREVVKKVNAPVV